MNRGKANGGGESRARGSADTPDQAADRVNAIAGQGLVTPTDSPKSNPAAAAVGRPPIPALGLLAAPGILAPLQHPRRTVMHVIRRLAHFWGCRPGRGGYNHWATHVFALAYKVKPNIHSCEFYDTELLARDYLPADSSASDQA